MTSSKEPVQCWKSSDGKVHDTLGDARTREYQIEAVQKIKNILYASSSAGVELNEPQAFAVAEFLVSHEHGAYIVNLIKDLAE